MAVDAYRDNFHATRVPIRMLGGHLLPQAFRPDVLSAVDQVRNGVYQPLGTATDGFILQGRTPKYAESGADCLKTRHIDSILVSHNERDHVHHDYSSKNAHHRVQYGDLLMNRSGAGSIGRCAVYLGSDRPFTNEHVIRLRFRDEYDSCFYAAFFSTWTGERILERGITGATGQLNLATEFLHELPIPTPDARAQHYIGSKVRQAEALREWARGLGNEQREHFEGLHSFDTNRRIGSWRQQRRGLDEERLDSTFYVPPAVTLVARLSAGNSAFVGDLVELVKSRQFNSNAGISYFEIGGVDIATGCAWPSGVAAGEAPSRAQRSVRAWDLLVATVRPERKNVGIVPPSARGQLVASSGFAVLRAKSPAMAVYLWGFLRCDAATEQLVRWNTGATYPAIDDDIPLKILLPTLPADQMENLGRRWMKIPMLTAGAKGLVTAARLLVEALIERKVTEADLITAANSPDADRALLTRLRTDGLDGEGDPLFADLDALTELLAEAANSGDA